MKRLVFLAMFFLSITASAQMIVPSASSESASCEETIVKASFDRPVRLLPVAGQPASAIAKPQLNRPPALNFELKSLSAKPIAAVDLMGRIKVKLSLYQLDSITREISIHLSSAEGSQRYTLSEFAVGFDSLYVTQVMYEDGTFWRPAHRFACGYQNSGSTLTAK
jgi:hypothetical protein